MHLSETGELTLLGTSVAATGATTAVTCADDGLRDDSFGSGAGSVGITNTFLDGFPAGNNEATVACFEAVLKLVNESVDDSLLEGAVSAIIASFALLCLLGETVSILGETTLDTAAGNCLLSRRLRMAVTLSSNVVRDGSGTLVTLDRLGIRVSSRLEPLGTLGLHLP